MGSSHDSDLAQPAQPASAQPARSDQRAVPSDLPVLVQPSAPSPTLGYAPAAAAATAARLRSVAQYFDSTQVLLLQRHQALKHSSHAPNCMRCMTKPSHINHSAMRANQ